MTKPTAQQLQDRLADAFPNDPIQVIDESHLHVGHAGAAGGAGHYRVIISSPRFDGLRLIAKHRLVYDAVADWMPDRVHALSIEIGDSP